MADITQLKQSNIVHFDMTMLLYISKILLNSYLQLPNIEKAIKDSGNTILTPLVSLDTPGKATVEVVIIADPVSMY
jgi:hypothetical protein